MAGLEERLLDGIRDLRGWLMAVCNVIVNNNTCNCKIIGTCNTLTHGSDYMGQTKF